MKFRLELINKNMGEDVYLMYQDIPSEELGSINKIKNCSIEQFYEIIEECKKLGMRKVRINCDDSNIASKRIIEKTMER